MIVRVADYIMKRIYMEGVKHIFYVPGAQCAYLTDAMRRLQEAEKIKTIAVHHEQTAAMATLAYSQYNENIGACLVTTGCAGTNAMTGVLHAYQDSIPCVFISGQQSVAQTVQASGLPLRQIGLQETNIVKLMSPITKYAVTLTNAEDVAWELDKAIDLARSGRRGPVWIDVPMDIQNQRIEEDDLRRYEKVEEKIEIDFEKINTVKRMLRESKRPVVLAGQGIRFAKGYKELKEYIEKFRVPVVFTRNSVDLLPTAHELNFGIVGSVAATRRGNFVIQNSDFVLSIGCRLSSDTTGTEREKFAREAKIVAVDVDDMEHQKDGVKLSEYIHCDAKDFLVEMIKDDWLGPEEWWIDKCKHWRKIFPACEESERKQNPFRLKAFLECMSNQFPKYSTITSDAGMTGAATPTNCIFKEGDRSIHSFAQGEMGFSLPGAIGAACASGNMVVAMTGDGSFMMNIQDIQTVVRNQFNIKIMINNNNAYSSIRHGQKSLLRGKMLGSDASNGLTLPDYEKIAYAFGIKYCRIENDGHAKEKIKEIFASQEPYLCEVMCDSEEFDLHNALVMYGRKKIGFRPIEDQSPFIDRDVFFEEMIVEPMETSYGKPI